MFFEEGGANGQVEARAFLDAEISSDLPRRCADMSHTLKNLTDDPQLCDPSGLWRSPPRPHRRRFVPTWYRASDKPSLVVSQCLFATAHASQNEAKRVTKGGTAKIQRRGANLPARCCILFAGYAAPPRSRFLQELISGPRATLCTRSARNTPRGRRRATHHDGVHVTYSFRQRAV